MAHLLGAEGISLSFPTKDVFDDVTVGLDEGDRIGVVGRNGDGKSTLLRILAGRQQPDSGRVTVRGGTRIGMLDQADRLPEDETIHHAVVGDRAEHEWAGDAKVRDVVHGLLGDLPFEARIGQLSGGQRRRVALAALLSREWDVVFLDEPRNSMGCTFRTHRFYRRGGQTSRPGARYRARARRAGVPGRSVLAEKAGC